MDPHFRKGKRQGRIGFKGRYGLVQETRFDAVVTIERQDELAIRGTKAAIASGRQPAIDLTDDTDGFFDAPEFFSCFCFVGAIIDNNQ